MIVLRSALFAVWMYGTLVVLGLAGLPLIVTRRGALWAIQTWARGILWGLRVIVGMKVELRGVQHRPSGPGLVASKHQGELDGIAPFALLDDPCFVLKRELMRLPILGWYAASSRMIPVDRGGGSAAVKALSAAARDRLTEARQIIIFPEGTRQLPGAPPAYKSGVSALYRDLDFPCVPVATNSGLFWPAKGLLRYPGVCVYEFLEPIPPGLKRADFMRTLEERIETASTALAAEARI
jgi:1-acyl-sn-glycerol-3-phosphate acyltransferase